ncbi:MAG: hypothetical protein D6731_19320, partial [Planctomycetota bacterium]
MELPSEAAELARTLGWTGELERDQEEALTLLLDDEFEELLPDGQAQFHQRLAAVPESPLEVCARCGCACLPRYRPDNGCCRRCGRWLDPERGRLRWRRDAAASGPAPVFLHAAPPANPAWELCSERSSPSPLGERLRADPENPDWDEVLAAVAARRKEEERLRREEEERLRREEEERLRREEEE